MSKFYVNASLPDCTTLDLKNVCATIEFLPTPTGKACEELIVNSCGKIEIVPYGTGEIDENGNVNSYNIVGFWVRNKI